MTTILYDIDTKKTSIKFIPTEETEGTPTYTGVILLQFSRYVSVPGYVFDTNKILTAAVGNPKAVPVVAVTAITLSGLRALVETPEWATIVAEYLEAMTIDIDMLMIELEDQMKGENERI